MSISLWDLRAVGGLATDGAYYEEVISSAKERFSTGRGDYNILATCSFFFSAFHRLCEDINGIAEFIASEWICFWFRGR